MPSLLFARERAVPRRDGRSRRRPPPLHPVGIVHPHEVPQLPELLGGLGGAPGRERGQNAKRRTEHVWGWQCYMHLRNRNGAIGGYERGETGANRTVTSGREANGANGHSMALPTVQSNKGGA